MTTVLTLLTLAAIAWLLFRWLTSGARKGVLHNVDVEAVDGDTLALEGVEESIRLARVDAPEVGQPGAEAATKALRTALEEADEAKIVSSEQDRYSRHVAEVEVDGKNLSDLLLSRGVVRPYVEDSLIFPAEKAKSLGDEPEKRYTFSIQYLPIPAAFRHAAIGLREQIRERKRNDSSFEEPLRKLYRLACVRNVLLSGALAPSWDQPLNPAVWEGLEFPYDKIGLEQLDLLGKRDRKRMRKVWGEPQSHRNVQVGAPEIAQRLKERHQLSKS